MSYLTCTNCGQKALSVATRCPHCGRPFDSRPFRYSASRARRSRIPLGLLIAGAVVIVLVVIGVRPKFSVAPPVRPPAKAIAATAESLPGVPSPAPRAPVESPPPPSDSTRQVASTPTAEPVDAGAVQRRYASTWMNVRADRSNTAPVIRILRPGEVVLVDGLKQGWYRVVTDRQAMGYVDQRYLDTLPPAAVSH